MTRSDTYDENTIRALPHLTSRRTVLGGIGAVGVALAFGSQVRGQQATPGAEPATPAAGTPAASPVASPVATRIPEPQIPERIGNLTIVRDQRPVYVGDPERSDELTLVRVGKENLDYNPSALAQDFQIPASYLEPLVRIEPVTMEPLPWLAIEWSWNDDGTVIEYALRDDVRWHDGERFTARDAVFSFTVYRDDVYSSLYRLFTNMVSAEAVDDLTLRVTLSEPDGSWIRNASSQLIFQREQYGNFWDAAPLGQRTLTGYDWGSTLPIGTGRWVITGFRDSRAQFKRNRDHWAESPWCSELRVDFVASTDAQIDRWLDGTADITWPIEPSRLEAAGAQSGVAYACETTKAMFAAFNFNNPARSDPTLLADIRIRRALSCAIDRNRYARHLWTGFFRPSVPGTILQPSLRLDGLENPQHDPARAVGLLNDAGFTVRRSDGLMRYPDGSALKLDVIVRRDDDLMLEAMLDSVAVDLAGIGVLLEVRRLSPDRFDQVWLTDHAFDMIAFSYSQYPGFTDFDLYGSDWDIRTNIQGFNPGGYRNEKVNRAIERALQATSENDLISALHAIQRQVNDEDLFALWLGSPLEVVLMQADIHGFQPNKVWPGMDIERLWRA